MLLDAIDEGEARLGDGGAGENGEEQRLHALHEELDEHLICERGQDVGEMLREFGGEYRAIACSRPPRSTTTTMTTTRSDLPVLYASRWDPTTPHTRTRTTLLYTVP